MASFKCKPVICLVNKLFGLWLFPKIYNNFALFFRTYKYTHLAIKTHNIILIAPYNVYNITQINSVVVKMENSFPILFQS